MISSKNFLCECNVCAWVFASECACARVQKRVLSARVPLSLPSSLR